MSAPMSRDRTEKYKELRQACHGPRSRLPPRLDDPGGIGFGAGRSGYSRMGNTELGPEWTEVLDEARAIMSEIEKLMKELTELHKKAICPTFSSSDDDHQETEIQVVSSQIGGLFKKAERCVKTIEEASRTMKEGSEEHRILYNVECSLASQLSTLSKRFREAQRRYLMTIRDRKARGQQVSSETIAWQESDFNEMRQEALTYNNFTPEQLEMLRLNEEMVNQRDKELQDICKSLVDLHEMFTDLNQLVIDQGTMLDRIDYNIERAHKSVVDGVEQLKQGMERQKSSRFKICFLLLCVLILIFTIILAAKVAT